MATKKLEKVMKPKAVKTGAKKAGDKGGKPSPFEAKSVALSNLNKGKAKKKVKIGANNPAGEPDDDDK